MSFDTFGVQKVKEEEVFLIVLSDSTAAKDKPVMKTSGDLDENGVRDDLKAKGVPSTKIDALIATARADWDRKHPRT